jgi:hypothetical protein
LKTSLAEGKEEEEMAEEQRQTLKDFCSFFEGTPCAEMMRTMMEAKKEGRGFNCTEMMPRMMQMFFGDREKTEARSKETKEGQPSHS